MINNIIKNRWSTLSLVTGLMISFSSCSDKWDDHYATVTHGDGTMWEAIAANPDLSNFKRTLEACDYEATLNGNQMVTVFAPVNSCFTNEMADSVIALYNSQKAMGTKKERNQAIKEFVRNHIALYNYSVSSTTNDTIVMMNRKYLTLSGTGASVGSFVESNKQTSNGILFTIDKVAKYTPNIYEALRRDADLDSVANFIYGYSHDVFSPESSVAGPIQDGKTIYLDSVTNLVNYFLTNSKYGLNAKLSNEDSTYWFAAPTNKVWKEQLEIFENYFVYDDSVNTKLRDSLTYHNPRRAMLRGNAFSLTRNPEKSRQDSMFPTLAYDYDERYYAWGEYALKYYQFDRPFDEHGIFSQTEDIECSNGTVKKLSAWDIDITNTFMKKITVEGESSYAVDSVYKKTNNTKDPESKAIDTKNPFYEQISNHKVTLIAPAATAYWKALLKVNDVLSNVPYDVYVVCAPQAALDTLYTAVRQVEFEVHLMCNDLKGTQQWIDKNGKTKKMSTDPPTSGRGFTVLSAKPDPTKVDSVFVGTFTFPTCSFGLDKAQVKMLLFEKDNDKDDHTRQLLLDCIVFKPHVD